MGIVQNTKCIMGSIYYIGYTADFGVSVVPDLERDTPHCTIERPEGNNNKKERWKINTHYL